MARHNFSKLAAAYFALVLLWVQTSLSHRRIYSSETELCWQPSKRTPRLVRRAVYHSQMGIPTIDKERGSKSINEQDAISPAHLLGFFHPFLLPSVSCPLTSSAAALVVTTRYSGLRAPNAPSPPFSPLAIPLIPRGGIAWVYVVPAWACDLTLLPRRHPVRGACAPKFKACGRP